MAGNAQRDQAAPVVPQDGQDEQQPKVDRRNHKEVHGTDTRHMVAQERVCQVWPDLKTFCHVFGHDRLSDLDPELEQFAMDARGTPQWVLRVHPSDQIANFNRNLRPAAA